MDSYTLKPACLPVRNLRHTEVIPMTSALSFVLVLGLSFANVGTAAADTRVIPRHSTEDVTFKNGDISLAGRL